jgi:hypothetical protein
MNHQGQVMSVPNNMQFMPQQQGMSTCAFPSPPARMVYCQPAAYQQINGQKYQKLVFAYGKARPMGAM